MHKSTAFLCVLGVSAFAQLTYTTGLVQGRITYYDQTTAGACDIPVSVRPAYTAALNWSDFQSGLACGATAVRFCRPVQSRIVAGKALAGKCAALTAVVILKLLLLIIDK